MRIELRDLIRITRVGEGRRPGEELALDVLCRQGELYALSFHGGYVTIGLEEASRPLVVSDIDEISTLAGEEVERGAYPFVPQTEVEVPVQLIHLLISQVMVGWLTEVESGLDQVIGAEG